jgi:ATP-dependent DNA ligase
MEREITTSENSLEGIVSRRKHPRYRSGRSRDWLKMQYPNAPAVKREAEEDWGKE